MINIITETLEPLITFVERFGGLVQTAKKVDVNEFGIPIEQRFPISCSVDASQCWETGKYLDLCPNDLYKSVFYFEDITGLRFADASGPGATHLTAEADLRLVGWLNLAKLGLTMFCSVTKTVVPVLIKNLTGSHTPNVPFDEANVKVQFLRQAPKSPDIFSAYTYDNTAMNFLLYPYDYFAIDFRVSFKINLNCVAGIDLGGETECVDQT